MLYYILLYIMSYTHTHTHTHTHRMGASVLSTTDCYAISWFTPKLMFVKNCTSSKVYSFSGLPPITCKTVYRLCWIGRLVDVIASSAWDNLLVFCACEYYIHLAFHMLMKHLCVLRKCENNQVFYRKGEPYPYCKNACEARTMCGEVQVPEHHLEVRFITCHVWLNHVRFVYSNVWHSIRCNSFWLNFEAVFVNHYRIWLHVSDCIKHKVPPPLEVIWHVNKK
jgi:hypothetical protein